MDKPLQLLQRTHGSRWDQIELTERGRTLAYTDDPAEVLEQSLSAMRFAVEPWSPPERVAKYGEFDLPVYEVTRRILRRCDGHIDRDEFDFFVSRIRTPEEVAWAVTAIAEYRALSPHERKTLYFQVSARIQGLKAYSNWRDVGLHTFSLFSLGTSMVRQGTRLLLTADWVTKHAPHATPAGMSPPELRMPGSAELEALLTPPAAPASNDGTDAESFVAKVLRSQGWKVAFYTNRRGYGFDLWARRENRAMVIEVKSSVGALGAVSLTPAEYRAARQHTDRYVLALVEHMDSDSPHLRIIQNPVANLEIGERMATSPKISVLSNECVG